MKKSDVAGYDIRFFAPSYKRPIRSITQVKYPQVKIVARESEAAEYEEAGNEVVVCPDSAQGNLCRVRNWILDENEEADAVVILDDDIRALGRWDRNERLEMSPDDLNDWVISSLIMCRDAGVKYFGMNLLPDRGMYMEHTPLLFVGIIGGPVQGFVMDEMRLRYDEELPLKEDYDMSLQQAYTYGGMLRWNMCHYHAKQSEQEGGCATYRTLEKEKEQFERLRMKWGSDVVRRDRGSRRGFDYNPIVRIPIKGV